MAAPMQPGARTKRRAIALLEVLLAAGFTAVACTAGAMLIKTIHDVSASGNGLHAGAAAARNAVACMDLLVEQAARIGHCDNDRLLLWRNDDNNDGRINLLEMTLIHHDPVTHQLSLQAVQLPSGTSAAIVTMENVAVPMAEFGTLAAAQRVESHDHVHVRPLVGGLTQFKAWCGGTVGQVRVAQVTFTVTGQDGSQAFHAVMAPRARIGRTAS